MFVFCTVKEQACSIPFFLLRGLYHNGAQAVRRSFIITDPRVRFRVTPSQIHARKMALAQVFLPVSLIFPANIVPPLLYTR